MFDFVRHDGAVQQSQVIFENDSIHGLRLQEPQTIASAGCGNQSVSLFLQERSTARDRDVCTERVASGHASEYIGRTLFGGLFKIAH